MTIVLQDHKSEKILDILNEDKSFVSSLQIDEYLPVAKADDLYIVKEILPDADKDHYIIKVKLNKDSKKYNPVTKFNEDVKQNYHYLSQLEAQIEQILSEKTPSTHIHSVARKGIQKIAKKFGEESVELVIESGKQDDDTFRNEAADVLYYFLILLHQRRNNFSQVLKTLKKQKRKNKV